MKDFLVVELTDPRKKQSALRLILESLPEWFGIPESREEYIREGGKQLCFAAYGAPSASPADPTLFSSASEGAPTLSSHQEQTLADCQDQTMPPQQPPVDTVEPHSGPLAGVLCLKPTGDATMELAVMGVGKEYHRCGIGRALFEAAKARARELGYQFLQVKTVQMGRYENYDATNRFYLSLGFREFEVFPNLWDTQNPCQIYVMAL